MAKYEILSVLAGAYIKGGRNRGEMGSTLTHMVELDDNGYPTKVMCRVKLDSICPDYSEPSWIVPSCQTCKRKWDRLSRTM
jgi:hypothetical protein